MKISVVMPTNRASYSAIARVFDLGSLDPSKFELIVRDNSENEEKRALLRQIDSPTLRLYTVAKCSGVQNAIESLRVASGDFVFFIADDDWVSVRGLEQLHSLALQTQADASVACLTGAYVVEMASATRFFQYQGLDAAEPGKRLESYLDANAANFLYYSAVKRSLANFCFAFVEGLPYRLSYHDQLISLLYVTLGRVLRCDRVVYSYELGEWGSESGALEKDKAAYLEAGLPVEYARLQCLLCAMEGALLLRSRLIADRVTCDRLPLSDLWFLRYFARFKHGDRNSGSEHSAAAAAISKLRNKWSDRAVIDLSELLVDVSAVLEIADVDAAKRYFDFWSTI